MHLHRGMEIEVENRGLYSFLICSFFLVKTFVSAYIWFLLKNAKCYSEQTQTVTRKTPITHISSNSYFRVWIISQTTFNVLEKLLWLARPRTASHWWVWVACLKWHRNTLYHWLLWIHSVQLSKLSPFLVFYFLIWNLGIRHSYFSRLLGINVASRILCGIHQKVVLFFLYFILNFPTIQGSFVWLFIWLVMFYIILKVVIDNIGMKMWSKSVQKINLEQMDQKINTAEFSLVD